jgi:hypothetical protein
MTSQVPPAGWYADPSGAPGHRWWDGQAWSAHFAPAAPQPVAATAQAQAVPASIPNYGYSGVPQQQYRPTATPTTNNRFALITFAVVALYLVIAFESRVVIFGILPLGLSLRSRQAREPLAPLAIAAAVVAILVAAVKLFG